jgi:hypothetical protein
MTPTLRVVGGHPDEDEVAAVVVAVAVAVASVDDQRRPEPPPRWRSALSSGPPARGPGAWRSAVRVA